MRFTHAWADLANQNLALKVAVSALSFCTVALALATTKLALRKPLIIERSCYSKAAAQAEATEHTSQEIEAFVKEALPMRFDSLAPVIPGFLSADEEQARASDQKELSNRNMVQKILVGQIKIAGHQVTVDADRVISAGSLRSAIAFSVIVQLSTTDRTIANPYGLMLSKVSQNTASKKEESK